MSYWKTFKRGIERCKLRLSLGLCGFEEGYSLDLLGYLIAMPCLNRWHREPEEIMDRWGFYYHDNAFVFCWKGKSKFYRMPWDWEHVKECHLEYCYVDGGIDWIPSKRSWELKHGEEPNKPVTWTLPWKYTLKNGTVQEGTAQVTMERREWRRRWLMWCPWFAMKRQSIDITFDREVGERAGSWKGGCIGTGYNMKTGESAPMAFERMMRERKFT